MRAKNYRKGVRTYKRLQEQLGENEPKTIDVEWVHPEDPIYDSFSHPPPQEYNRTLNSYGSIQEVDPKTIRIEMEHRWKEGHAPMHKGVRPLYAKKPHSGLSGSDLELIFIFGFGGMLTCFLLISFVHMLTK